MSCIPVLIGEKAPDVPSTTEVVNAFDIPEVTVCTVGFQLVAVVSFRKTCCGPVIEPCKRRKVMGVAEAPVPIAAWVEQLSTHPARTPSIRISVPCKVGIIFYKNVERASRTGKDSGIGMFGPQGLPIICITAFDTKGPAISPTVCPIPAVKIKEVIKPVGKAFYFKLVNAGDGSEINSGELRIQEGMRASQYQVFKPSEVIYLEAPKNAKGLYTVVTQLPGYTPTNSVFNYQNPSAKKGNQEELIIELQVTKAKKGDYTDFNNVKFFTNASLLQPAAQNELDGLVDLMKENLKYRIKVHGHVNGKRERESITRGEKSDFFGLNRAADKSTKRMSAMDLSTARAESVRDYLVTQGIDANRIKIKGEGGRILLYPEAGLYGAYNDRVEIEFLKN